MPKILVGSFFFVDQQQQWKSHAAEVCAGPRRGKGKQRGQLPLGWKASVHPEHKSRVQQEITPASREERQFLPSS